MRKAFGNVMICLGCLLLCGALALTGSNLYTQEQAGETATATLETLKAQLPPPKTEVEPSPPPAYDPSLVEIPDHILDPEMDMPETEVDGVNYIGYLAIPALDLDLPIITQSTVKLLKMAPCRFTGSAYLDDLVIGGHNYERHFGTLKNLSQGDEIIFTDVDGNVFTYHVVDFEILGGDQAEELCSGEWDLSLFTCTIGGKSRLTVRCERAETL